MEKCHDNKATNESNKLELSSYRCDDDDSTTCSTNSGSSLLEAQNYAVSLVLGVTKEGGTSIFTREIKEEGSPSRCTSSAAAPLATTEDEFDTSASYSRSCTSLSEARYYAISLVLGTNDDEQESIIIQGDNVVSIRYDDEDETKKCLSHDTQQECFTQNHPAGHPNRRRRQSLVYERHPAVIERPHSDPSTLKEMVAAIRARVVESERTASNIVPLRPPHQYRKHRSLCDQHDATQGRARLPGAYPVRSVSLDETGHLRHRASHCSEAANDELAEQTQATTPTLSRRSPSGRRLLLCSQISNHFSRHSWDTSSMDASVRLALQNSALFLVDDEQESSQPGHHFPFHAFPRILKKRTLRPQDQRRVHGGRMTRQIAKRFLCNISRATKVVTREVTFLLS